MGAKQQSHFFLSRDRSYAGDWRPPKGPLNAGLFILQNSPLAASLLAHQMAARPQGSKAEKYSWPADQGPLNSWWGGNRTWQRQTATVKYCRPASTAVDLSLQCDILNGGASMGAHSCFIRRLHLAAVSQAIHGEGAARAAWHGIIAGIVRELHKQKVFAIHYMGLKRWMEAFAAYKMTFQQPSITKPPRHCAMDNYSAVLALTNYTLAVLPTLRDLFASVCRQVHILYHRPLSRVWKAREDP